MSVIGTGRSGAESNANLPRDGPRPSAPPCRSCEQNGYARLLARLPGPARLPKTLQAQQL